MGGNLSISGRRAESRGRFAVPDSIPRWWATTNPPTPSWPTARLLSPTVCDSMSNAPALTPQTMYTSPRRGQNEMVRSSSVPAETPMRERPS